MVTAWRIGPLVISFEVVAVEVGGGRCSLPQGRAADGTWLTTL